MGAGPDVLLNRIWGTAGHSRYLYALRNPVPRVFGEPADALSDWKCAPSSNHSIVLDVTPTKPAIVHLSELMYPGWTVSIDGEPAESTDADDLLRSVEVPAGEHVVEWSFESASVTTGIWISCAVLCSLWLLPLVPARQTGRIAES